MSELFWCKLHDHAVEIPEGAIEIETKTKTYKLWKFPDGSLHDLRKPTNTKTEAGHMRLHVKNQIKKPGCRWCYPELTESERPQADLEPQPGQDLAKVLDLKELPGKEVNREPEPEPTDKIMGIGRTQMQAAFERLRSNRE